MPSVPDFRPVHTQTATEFAIAQLIEMVRTGKLKPGDRVPPQRQLTGLLGLSYTIIREALRGLASMGIVEIRHGRGVFVRSVSAEMLVQPETLFFLLEREAFAEAIEVRRILEVETLALAATRATESDLATLGGHLEQMKCASTTPDALSHSGDFHLALARASHNQVLANMMQSFIRLIDQAAVHIARTVPESASMEFPQHHLLYEAVVLRDPELARRRMREHLDTAECHLQQAFDTLTDPGRNPDTATQGAHE